MGIVLAIVVAAVIQCTAAQITHQVGDSMGWVIPPGGSIAYSTWASNNQFKIGDTLVFNFSNGAHDVAKVSKAAYDACNGTSTISLLLTSPANFTLDTEGEHYFICTFGQHCSLGQKLAINVTATSAPTASPPASPPASTPSPVSAPTPSSSRTPVIYTVGDSMGWIIPPGGPIAYSTWAFNKTFIVGDNLVFNFTTGSHDVAEVTKAVFDSCNSTSSITLFSTGPANITLTSEGEHYYICTYGQHCTLGQKLAINVTASTTATPPSSPATPPSSSPATPPSSQATPPSSSATPPSSSGTPPPSSVTSPPSSSSPSVAVAGFSVTFLSIAIALLF
ncbi:hypothetical protein HHK36_021444 [Tetracentron sinense]|uniref:Phytocyanin domain-containing protein n=1 Tax=Tetracentron sinense TaxID=13715 RepID=A0A834YV09_TETSI|nr:hypothetical protein HHK36_021444 [Tetracentron sinense]